MAERMGEQERRYQELDRLLLRLNADGKPGRISERDHIRAFRSVTFRRVEGFSRNWESGHAEHLQERIGEALAGFWQEGAELVFSICSDGKKNSFYLGAVGQDALAALRGVFSGALMDVRFSDQEKQILDLIVDAYAPDQAEQAGGVIIGMPRLPVENAAFMNPVESILAGMQGEPFCLLYVLRAVAESTLSRELAALFAQKRQAARDEQYSQSGTTLSEQTFQIVNYSCGQYLSDLEKLEQHLLDARETGTWQVAGYYLAPNLRTARRLSSLIRSVYNGKSAGPEPLTCRPLSNAINYASQLCFIPPLRHLNHPLAAEEENPFSNPFCTQLSSRQAATLLMLPGREMPGFYVNEPAYFDLTDRNTAEEEPLMQLGQVLLSAYSEVGVGEYRFPVPDLSRHALIVGATGGGKSNTVRSMLLSLYGETVRYPFLVIESAKSEYWQLSAFAAFSDLCVMPLGDMSSPFRLNPFECSDRFSLQTHVDSLLSAFRAAFEMYTPMPFILEQAVYEVYADYGWDIATGDNPRQVRLYPTLSDLYWQIPVTVEKTAYDKEIRDNVTGALQTRVRSLMTGGKGLMLNARKSTSLDELLTRPVVLELEGLGDDETKAFVMGLLMNRLYEFRKVESAGFSRPFRHLLIIEEAHRLLKNIPQEQDGARAASVEFFCNMLSEIRSYGQGILIVDQSPVKLARDSLRNTNLKIVHRIVDQDDRDAVGGAMHMEDDHKEALTVLRRGVAAVYSEGDNRPKLVKFPLVKADRIPEREAALARAMDILRTDSAPSKRGMMHAACRYCPCSASRGTCMCREEAAECQRIALLPFQKVPDAQRADYIGKYLQHGPNPLLTDAIVLYALRREMAVQKMPAETRERAAWDAEVHRKLCVAGFTLQQLSTLDQDTQELIIDRYHNLLIRRV